MIFKSKQVNLDKRPWSILGVEAIEFRQTEEERAENLHFPGVYDPRPEFEPTRDPLPHACQKCSGRWPVATDDPRHGPSVWAPRREQFDTPVNRLLAFFRGYYEARMIPLARAARAAAESVDEMFGDYTPDEIEHARKVLTRLAGWRA